MAFTPQNDSGTVAGANAYGSLAGFKTYHDDRGNSYAAYTDQELQEAIVSATDYLDGRWDFVGVRLTEDQTTEWPRRDAEDNQGYVRTGIPVDVIEATYEYALISAAAVAAGSSLDPTPDRDSSGSAVVSKMEKVGPIAESKTLASSGTYTPPEYPVADRKLARLVVSPGFADRG
jgi:hypothetical protein